MNYIVSILINHRITGIIIVAFCEAIFLPIPVEFVSIPIYLADRTEIFQYSIVLVIFSSLGSITGYYLSKKLSYNLINKFISTQNFNKLKTLYNKNAFLTILTSAFTPIPYEAYVLSAGAFNVKFKKFILASILSRILRHIPQAILIALYGDIILVNLKRYTLGFASIIFLLIFIYKKYKKRASN